MKIGQPCAGGFYAGIIDTTRGNIPLFDVYQKGLRYALIVSSKSLEATMPLSWTRLPNGGEPEKHCLTRWNGLDATNNMRNISDYPAFEYVRSLGYAPQHDNASNWYLPALDELELLYRYFKPTTCENDDYSYYSRNRSSDDVIKTPYTKKSPPQTSLSQFRAGGEQALDKPHYWTSSDGGMSIAKAWAAWTQGFTEHVGQQYLSFKENTISIYVRPVRRIYLVN